jgi:hypothetical protein
MCKLRRITIVGGQGPPLPLLGSGEAVKIGFSSSILCRGSTPREAKTCRSLFVKGNGGYGDMDFKLLLYRMVDGVRCG